MLQSLKWVAQPFSQQFVLARRGRTHSDGEFGSFLHIYTCGQVVRSGVSDLTAFLQFLIY